MIKRLLSLFLACVFALVFCSTVFACDEGQTNTYLLQILFGDSSAVHENKDNTKMLLNALYLCSEQSGNNGQEKIDYLKRKKVYSVPSLSELRVKKELLMECSHNSWEHECIEVKKAQTNRKKLLQNTVNKVFDFGFLNNIFGSSSGKCNSFAAILYYSHILADCLADDPYATEVNVKGRLVPSYAGKTCEVLNGDKPIFTAKEKKNTSISSSYSQLDWLGRTGVAFAVIGYDILPPSGSRESIGGIKPSGWNQQKYKTIIGTENTPGYIYERSHLIAHQLGGKDIDINLITGTYYLNHNGMIPIEDEIRSYVERTKNHVLYRVTPVYKGDNLLASGVQIEAFSIEDNGDVTEGICRNRFYYNVQPGFNIDYSNGSNSVSDLTFGCDDVLPFAINNANENQPDLIFEMNKHFEILFDDQIKTNTYKTMLDNIKKIADQARENDETGYNAPQHYIIQKEFEYQYFEVLKSYLPLLLKKEDFFISAFK